MNVVANKKGCRLPHRSASFAKSDVILTYQGIEYYIPKRYVYSNGRIHAQVLKCIFGNKIKFAKLERLGVLVKNTNQEQIDQQQIV